MKSFNMNNKAPKSKLPEIRLPHIKLPKLRLPHLHLPPAKFVLIAAAALVVVTVVLFVAFGRTAEDVPATVPNMDVAALEATPAPTPVPTPSEIPSETPSETPTETPSTVPEDTVSSIESTADSVVSEEAKPEPEKEPAKAAADAAPQINWTKTTAEFELKAKKYYGGYSSNHYEYTPKELKMLATVIYLEARGEPYKCQVAVANVVMNRVLSSGYPGNTIAAVVTPDNQFCYNASVQPSARCISVARDVLDFEVWTVPQNTYFFKATNSKSNWGGHKYYDTYGNTAFYTDSYSGRKNIKTIPAQLFDRVYKWPQYGCEPAKRVRKIQLMLAGMGYKVKTDGYFGMDTKEALMQFQKSRGFKADGIAGPSTIKSLIKKYGIAKYLKL